MTSAQDPNHLPIEASALSRLVSRVLLGVIRLYQITLSSLIGNQCRFYPTCSHYAAEAIRRHGPFRGSVLAVKRIGRCHPFHPGGVDEVPKFNVKG